jgi:hypothetical protein
MLNSSKISAAPFIILLSELDPIIIPTKGFFDKVNTIEKDRE